MLDKQKLTTIVRTAIIKKFKALGVNKFQEYKVINQVPEIVAPLMDLMGKDFDRFIKNIDWVAPKPETFRVILENDQYFYLIDLVRSWVAEIEGKKYYLLNLAESERAALAISRILRYGKPVAADGGFGGGGSDSGGFGGGGEANFPGSEPAGGGGGEFGAEEGGAEEAPEEIAPGFEEFEELPG